MKGLIIKDLKNNKSNILAILGACIILLILKTDIKFVVSFSTLILGLFFMVTDSINIDKKTNFTNYAIVMPVKKHQIVLEKYVFMTICVLFTIIVSIAITFCNANYLDAFLFYFFIIFAIANIFVIMFPFLYLAKTNVGYFIWMYVLFSIYFYGSIGLAALTSFNILTKYNYIILPSLGAGFVVLFFLSYKLSYYIFKKNIN